MGMGSEIDPEFNLKIAWKVDLLGGINHEFLATKIAFGSTSQKLRYAINLRERLKEFAPDVVFFQGYATFLELQTLIVAKSLGLPVIVRPDGNEKCLKRNIVKAALRSIFLRGFYKFVDAYLSVGSLSTEHFLGKGGNSEKLIPCRHSVDNDYFTEQHRQLVPVEKLKSELQLERFKKIILFCGKLIAKKDPTTLLRAFESCRFNSSVGLVFVGTGELESQLKITANHPNPQIHFAGFINQDKISHYFQIADILVLGSQYGETWGLVINEAMNFGVVPVVSNLVGCAPDLVTMDTGRVFDTGDEASLAAILRELIDKPEVLKNLSQSALERIKQYDMQQAVDGFRKAIELTTGDSLDYRSAKNQFTGPK